MYVTFHKALPSWVATIALCTLCACSSVDEPASLQEAPSQAKEARILMRVAAFKKELPANVTSVDLFQFSDSVIVRRLSVDPSKDNVVELSRTPNTRIYALAGYSVAGRKDLGEKDFSMMTIPVPDNAHSAPIFYSSVIDMPEDSDDFKLELHRGVARLDIENKDAGLKIEKVMISGASSSTQIFPTDRRSFKTESAIYTKAYEDGIDGVEESAFILFETCSPITVTVCGRRNGEAVKIATETPTITRNSIYTVSIDKEESFQDKGRTYSGSDDDDDDYYEARATIRVRKWENGDVETGTIDLGESAIHLAKSYIPAGVKVNSADNTVTVPADGVSGMKLAFMTSSPLNLGSVLSDSEGVCVTPLAVSSTENGYLSEFRVDVAKQPKGAMQYVTSVFFNGSSSFFCNIEVEASPYQIPTVHIGGHDWMCFNAVSRNPEDQIYLSKGMTVRDMYKDRFADCIGNFFQYGRPEPFSPWRAYDPNCLAGQKRDVPWTSKSMMPLPKGYHVPSASEWEDLIPNGTVIPATYRTRTGDSIRASIVVGPYTLDGTPSAATNAQNYLERGVLFESVTTGARLFLPMGGIKTNTSSEIPTHPNYRFDTKSGYWMKEDRNVMMLSCERRGDGSEGIQLKRNNWHGDGFVMVRGIRD
ncbi:MAG: hypothetical protein K2K98_13950 [Muribaculaceae bacterium]|nr:hypothetical protein [Muribaculaceae bacterium]